MKKLRLLLASKCNRDCKGCCNKGWNLDSLKVCEDYEGYDEIMITGGEPALYPIKILAICKAIRRNNPKAKIYLYTALPKVNTVDLLNKGLLDGITLTLHDQRDVVAFELFQELLCDIDLSKKSLKLNVFKGVNVVEYPIWKSNKNMVWIKDCPLPENEVFMKYEGYVE